MGQAYSPSFNTSAKYQRVAHVKQSYCRGGVALWDERSDNYYYLNDSGAELWQHLAFPSSEATLVRKLGRDFEATHTEMQGSVRPLLKKLLADGLVRAA